jgi:hypothetical protein
MVAGWLLPIGTPQEPPSQPSQRADLASLALSFGIVLRRVHWSGFFVLAVM